MGGTAPYRCQGVRRSTHTQSISGRPSITARARDARRGAPLTSAADDQVDVAQVRSPLPSVPLLVRRGDVGDGVHPVGVPGVRAKPALPELVVGAPELRLPCGDAVAHGLRAAHASAAARAVVGDAVRGEERASASTS